MKPNPVLPGERSDFLDRLDGADLVVGMHDAYQNGLGSDGAAHSGNRYNGRRIKGSPQA
jgi:hypothetical protein